VNGPRSNANDSTVDGVGANTACRRPPQARSVKVAPVTSRPEMRSETRTGLVSVDARQAFRVQTSACTPEFGRTPSAQVSIVTPLGTNVSHGNLVDYFRDYSMKATDRFVNRSGQPELELRPDRSDVATRPLVGRCSQSSGNAAVTSNALQ
jgi:hypothetical protein